MDLALYHHCSYTCMSACDSVCCLLVSNLYVFHCWIKRRMLLFSREGSWNIENEKNLKQRRLERENSFLPPPCYIDLVSKIIKPHFSAGSMATSHLLMSLFSRSFWDEAKMSAGRPCDWFCASRGYTIRTASREGNTHYSNSIRPMDVTSSSLSPPARHLRENYRVVSFRF